MTQSLHLTIKEPPDPNPKRTLGVFDFDDPEIVLQVIEMFLREEEFSEPHKSFHSNVRDEVVKLLMEGSRVISVSREGRIINIKIKEKTRNG